MLFYQNDDITILNGLNLDQYLYDSFSHFRNHQTRAAGCLPCFNLPVRLPLCLPSELCPPLM